MGLGPDRTIRWFGARQYDVVSRRQLLGAGVSAGEIDGRVRRGVLVRVFRGVFTTSAVAASHEGRVMAALLAGPAGAVASHRTAAALRGMVPVRTGPVHLTSAGPQHRRPGIVVHRSLSHDSAATVFSGLPCTSMARTVVDLAASEGPVVTERAWSTSAGNRTLRPRAIESELRRFGGRPGTAIVRRLLERHRVTITGRTRSELENAALAMCSVHDLVPPRASALVEVEGASYEADLLWDAPRVIVELDAWSTHGDPHSFRTDRARDFDLGLTGWLVVRLVWADVTTDAERTADRLRRLFQRRLRELERRW